MASDVNFQEKTDWTLDQIVNPVDANRWEQGIKDCADLVNNHNQRIPTLETGKVDKAGDTMSGPLKAPTPDFSSDDTTVINRDWAAKKFSRTVSNCITKIPQDIKLELSSEGVLTLKAGSKLYIPNGVGQFKEVVTSVDVQANVGEPTGQRVLLLTANSASSLAFQVGLNGLSLFSGASQPTVTAQSVLWYDTTNNVFKKTNDSGSTWNIAQNITFPIGIATFNSGVATSIDQIFNGCGYLGSTRYILPGIELLCPNGRNPDGSLNNSKIINSAIDVYSFSGKTTTYIFKGSGRNSYQPYFVQNEKPKTNGVWYSPAENIMRLSTDGINWTQIVQALVGILKTGTNGIIESFDIKNTFNAVDYNEYINAINNKADKDFMNTGFIPPCILSAPKGIVTSGDTSFWYDSWTPNNTISSQTRSSVKVSSTITANNTLTLEQLNGNWTVINKVKFTRTYETTKFKGIFSRLTLNTEDGTSGSYGSVYIELNNSSGSVIEDKPFKVRIYPDYNNDTLFKIETSVVPQADTWYWLKLVKTGTTYTLSYSTNGSSYQQIGSVSGVDNFSGISGNCYTEFSLYSSASTGTLYADLSSNAVNNVFIGDSNEPLVTYLEGNRLVVAKSDLTVLLPAGRNEDGALNNEKFTLTTDRSFQISSSMTGDLQNIVLTKSSIGSVAVSNFFISETTPNTPISKYKYWINPKQNKTYISNDTQWVETAFVVIGQLMQKGGAITYFKEGAIFNIANNADPNLVSSQGKPSSRYLNLTLGGDGSTYTAPADGWLLFSKKSTAANQFIHVGKQDLGNVGVRDYSVAADNTLSVIFPFKKGQSMYVSYSAAGETVRFSFIYDEGAK